MPVMQTPMCLAMGNRYVMDVGSTSLSCTFFCETNTTDSWPRTATDVKLDDRTALNAYSVGRSSRGGEESGGVGYKGWVRVRVVRWTRVAEGESQGKGSVPTHAEP